MALILTIVSSRSLPPSTSRNRSSRRRVERLSCRYPQGDFSKPSLDSCIGFLNGYRKKVRLARDGGCMIGKKGIKNNSVQYCSLIGEGGSSEVPQSPGWLPNSKRITAPSAISLCLIHALYSGPPLSVAAIT